MRSTIWYSASKYVPSEPSAMHVHDSRRNTRMAVGKLPIDAYPRPVHTGFACYRGDIAAERKESFMAVASGYTTGVATNYAGFGIRLVAWIIDAVILAIISVILN